MLHSQVIGNVKPMFMFCFSWTVLQLYNMTSRMSTTFLMLYSHCGKQGHDIAGFIPSSRISQERIELWHNTIKATDFTWLLAAFCTEVLSFFYSICAFCVIAFAALYFCELKNISSHEESDFHPYNLCFKRMLINLTKGKKYFLSIGWKKHSEKCKIILVKGLIFWL